MDLQSQGLLCIPREQILPRDKLFSINKGPPRLPLVVPLACSSDPGEQREQGGNPDWTSLTTCFSKCRSDLSLLKVPSSKLPQEANLPSSVSHTHLFLFIYLFDF